MPVAAEKISLNALSRYLNQLSTAKGAFTQVNDDGTISTGTIFIKRPGRIRFEYNPPEKALVLASGGTVVIMIPRLMSRLKAYPLARTPLSIILAKNVKSVACARWSWVTRRMTNPRPSKRKIPEHPEYGNIELVFTSNPIELRQWVINDDAGKPHDRDFGRVG